MQPKQGFLSNEIDKLGKNCSSNDSCQFVFRKMSLFFFNLGYIPVILKYFISEKSEIKILTILHLYMYCLVPLYLYYDQLLFPVKQPSFNRFHQDGKYTHIIWDIIHSKGEKVFESTISLLARNSWTFFQH